MRFKPPCKDCPDRHTACHDSCEKYKKYRAEIDSYAEAKHKVSHIDMAIKDKSIKIYSSMRKRGFM